MHSSAYCIALRCVGPDSRSRLRTDTSVPFCSASGLLVWQLMFQSEDNTGMTELELKTQLHVDAAVVSGVCSACISAGDSRGLQEKGRAHHCQLARIVCMVQQIAGAEGKRQIVAMLRSPTAEASAAPPAAAKATAAAAAAPCPPPPVSARAPPLDPANLVVPNPQVRLRRRFTLNCAGPVPQIARN